MDIIRCRKCGYELFPMDTVCEKCGTPVAGGADTVPASNDAKKLTRPVSTRNTSYAAPAKNRPVLDFFNSVAGKVTLGIVSAVLVAVIVIGVVLSMRGFRTIIVEALNGVTMVANGGDENAAHQGQKLKSGDYVSVSHNSDLTMSLDNTKYVYAESDTEFGLEATGKKADSKTVIRLSEGSTLYNIEKLNENEEFKVDTPNATMAVRGTVFSVQCIRNENGDIETILQVFDGAVSIELIGPDGSRTDESMTVNAGESVKIHTDDKKTVFIEDGDGNTIFRTDANSMSDGARQFLADALNDRTLLAANTDSADSAESEETDRDTENTDNEQNENNDSITGDTESAEETEEEEEDDGFIETPDTGDLTLPVRRRSNKIKWEIDESGMLTISGKGDYESDEYVEFMGDEDCEYDDMGDGDFPAWIKYADMITSARVTATGMTSTHGMFALCENLKSVDMTEFKTDSVTDMGMMFFMCRSLTGLDLSGFNTDNVTYMSEMFSGCKSLTELDLSSFDTHNVTRAAGMFRNCKSLKTLNVSSFNTENLESMVDYGEMHNPGAMFENCKSLESLDLSNFDTSNVDRMDSLFTGCEKLQYLDISNFNTSNIQDLAYMFRNCKSLENIDLSSLDTSSATRMSGMFYGCENLLSIDLSLFNTSNVYEFREMFYGCKNLTVLDASYLDMTKIDNENWADDMFEGCDNLYTLYTPANVHVELYLPGLDYGDVWYLPDGSSTEYLPFNNSTVVARNYVP